MGLQCQSTVDRTKVRQRRESTSGFRGGVVRDDRLTSLGSSSATVGPEEPEVVTIKEEPEDPDDSQSWDAGYCAGTSRRSCAFAMDEGLQLTPVKQMAELEGGGDQGETFDLSLPLPLDPVVCSRPCDSREAHRQHVQSSRYPGGEQRLSSCDICQRPFGRIQHLLRHQGMHEPRPAPCPRTRTVKLPRRNRPGTWTFHHYDGPARSSVTQPPRTPEMPHTQQAAPLNAETEDQPPESPSFNCELCPESYASWQDLLSHIGECHP